jgi:hypothetical protein
MNRVLLDEIEHAFLLYRNFSRFKLQQHEFVEYVVKPADVNNAANPGTKELIREAGDSRRKAPLSRNSPHSGQMELPVKQNIHSQPP